jgi:Fe-S-cluster-containing dehydrogenase component
MAKFGIAIDIEKCTGCHSCFLACKDEFCGNDYLPNSAAQPEAGHKWIRLTEVEQGTGSKVKVDYIPVMCQHCENPPCASAGPEGSVYRREDGIVIFDPEKAKGCKAIVNSCPYRAVFWNEEKQLPQKCTLCAHMIDSGEKTVRCVEVCPTGALVFGDLENPNSEIAKLLAEKQSKIELYKPEIGTQPAIKYMNLPKPFIAGEVLLSNISDECVNGATVILKAADGKEVAATKTNFFGDFEFRNLALNTEYTIVASNDGYKPQEITVKMHASQNVGELVLRPLA